MIGINSAKEVNHIREVANEIVGSSGFKTVKEVVLKPIETKAPTIGRDLLPSARSVSEIHSSDLLNRGYKMGYGGIIYKVDPKKGIYKGVHYDMGQVKNITISDTVAGRSNVTTTRMNDGSWVSIADHGKGVANFSASTSEKAAKKASELQFDGFKLIDDGQASMKFLRGQEVVVISKETGKLIK